MKISESSLHIASVKALDTLFASQWPKYMINGRNPLMHSPGGELRTKRTASKLKAMNVIPGFPDFYYVVPSEFYTGLACELKRPKTASQRAGTMSPEQKEWKQFMENVGIKYVICYSVQDVVNTVIKYMGDV
jgi:hypothetical protein